MRTNRPGGDWFAVHGQAHSLQVRRRALPAAWKAVSVFHWFCCIRAGPCDKGRRKTMVLRRLFLLQPSPAFSCAGRAPRLHSLPKRTKATAPGKGQHGPMFAPPAGRAGFACRWLPHSGKPFRRNTHYAKRPGDAFGFHFPGDNRYTDAGLHPRPFGPLANRHGGRAVLAPPS